MSKDASTWGGVCHAPIRALLRQDYIAFLHKAVETATGERLRLLRHVEWIGFYLLLLHSGVTRRLIINQPPRTMKSMMVAAYLAWTLGRDPSTKIAVITHSEDLAEELLARVRRIVESDWYGEAFPQADCRLARSNKGVLEMAGLGGVRAFSLSSGITGHGFDLIVIDDPIDAKDASRESQRQLVIDRYANGIESRLNNKRTGRIIVVMQRLHANDLCGYLLDQGGWTHCCVPLVADKPITQSIGERQWTRQAGDILDTEIYPAEWVEKQREVNRSVFLAQYQQRPDLVQGGLIQEDWLRVYTALPEGCQTYISVDLASSLRDGASKSAMVVFAVPPGGRHYFVVEVVRRQAEFTTLVDLALELIGQYRPKAVLVEDASTGTALISTLQAQGAPVRPVRLPKRSKSERLQSHLDVFFEGRLLVPQYAPWVKAFFDELMQFPNGSNDDQVDCLTQFLNWIIDPGNTTPPKYIASSAKVRSTHKPHPQRNPNARPRGRW